MGCPITPAPLLERLSSSIVLFLPFCQKSVDHICVGLFLVSLICYIVLCVCCSTSTTQSLLWFYKKSWNWVLIPYFILLFQNYFNYFSSFVFSYNFWIILSVSTNNHSGTLIGLALYFLSIWGKLISSLCKIFHCINTTYFSISIDLWFLSSALCNLPHRSPVHVLALNDCNLYYISGFLCPCVFIAGILKLIYSSFIKI